MTEDRGQRTEDRGQRTEDRGQRTEDRGQMTEDRGQKEFVGVQTLVCFRIYNKLHSLDWNNRLESLSYSRGNMK
jgi:hypothetical protein